MTYIPLDTPRQRLMATAAYELHATREYTTLSDDAIWLVIDDTARCISETDLDVGLYYDGLTSKAQTMLIKDVLNLWRKFDRTTACAVGEWVLLEAATNRAKGWFKVKGATAYKERGLVYYLEPLTPGADMRIAKRFEFKRAYRRGDIVYWQNGSYVVSDNAAAALTLKPLQSQDVTTFEVPYDEVTPGAIDIQSGVLYPLDQMKPFYHHEQGWSLTYNAAAALTLALDGGQKPLTAAHKAILTRLKPGAATRSMLSVAAFNHYQALAGHEDLDRWRRNELKELIAAGLVEFCDYLPKPGRGNKKAVYRLTASGQEGAAGLAEKPFDMKRTARVIIDQFTDGLTYIKIWRYRQEANENDFRTYEDKHLTAASRKRLYYLLWGHNWLFKYIDEFGGFTRHIYIYEVVSC